MSDTISLPRTNAPLVTIAIPAGDVAGTLVTLRSIARNPPRVAFEVIAILGAASVPELDRLAAVAGLRCVVDERALAPLAACNRAADLARGRYLHLLAAGSEVAAGWLDALLAVFARADCGIAGSKLLRRDGRLFEAGAIVRRDGTREPFGGGEDPGRSACNYLRPTDACALASLLIPTALFVAVGRLDGASHADADLAFRVRAAGREIYYQPRSHAVLPEAPPAGDAGAFRDRWRDVLDREQLPPGADDFVARDRSRDRKAVLVFDHYVPEPDHDAGSRSMWHMLRQLVAMGLNVKFWPDNLHDHRPYAIPLEAIGIQVMHGAELHGRFDDWIAENGRFIDYAILSRPYVSDRYVESLRRHSAAKLIYWGVDLHYRRMLLQAEVQGDAKVAADAEVMRVQELKQWRTTDAILYPSDSETAEVLATMPGARAHTLPLYAYETMEADDRDGPGGRADILFVGGFRHAPNIDAASWLVRTILPVVRSVRPEVRLTLAGADPTAEVLALAGDGVTVTGHLSDDALVARYRGARVAIVPLRFGGGVKGKVLEALYSGVPLVTTSVGVQGLPGLPAIVPTSDDAETLAAHVLRYLADDAAWRRAAADGRGYIRENFGPDRMRGVLEREIDATPRENAGR